MSEIGPSEKSPLSVPEFPQVVESTNSVMDKNKNPEMNSPPQTILRLKRRIEESPSRVLVMSYKRRKEENVIPCPSFSSTSTGDVEADENICSRVFRLAGTVTEDKLDSSVATTIKNALLDVSQNLKPSVEEKQQTVKRRVIRLKEKTNEQARKASTENRFRVVCNKRGIESDENVPNTELLNEAPDLLGSESKRLFNLLDLVADDSGPEVKKPRKCADPREPGSITCNGAPMMKEKNAAASTNNSTSATLASTDNLSGFVFDLYVSNEGAVGDHIHDQLVSVRRADEDYEFDFYQEGNSDEEVDVEDEDSNDEGNWKNEYPDTDPDSENDTGGFRGYYEDEDDYVGNFDSMKLYGDDLSSSEEEGTEGPIHSMENDGADGGLGGIYSHARYEAFKARYLEQEISNEVVSSPDESDID